jgi:hypothetical protein
MGAYALVNDDHWLVLVLSWASAVFIHRAEHWGRAIGLWSLRLGVRYLTGTANRGQPGR